MCWLNGDKINPLIGATRVHQNKDFENLILVHAMGVNMAGQHRGSGRPAVCCINLLESRLSCTNHSVTHS